MAFEPRKRRLMTSVPPALWLTAAGLGAFHGLNPAMGWLFAVALGPYAHSRRVALLSLVPIALGHAISVALVLAGALTLGSFIGHDMLARCCGVLLIGWGVVARVARAPWTANRRHAHRTRGPCAMVFRDVERARRGALMLVAALLPLVHDAAPRRRSTAPPRTAPSKRVRLRLPRIRPPFSR